MLTMKDYIENYIKTAWDCEDVSDLVITEVNDFEMKFAKSNEAEYAELLKIGDIIISDEVCCEVIRIIDNDIKTIWTNGCW